MLRSETSHPCSPQSSSQNGTGASVCDCASPCVTTVENHKKKTPAHPFSRNLCCLSMTSRFNAHVAVAGPVLKGCWCVIFYSSRAPKSTLNALGWKDGVTQDHIKVVPGGLT